MTLETYLWTCLAAFLTLATFSFLYKDNPFYKFVEHLFVGVSAAYFVVILWQNGLEPNLFSRLSDGHWYALWLDSSRPWYVIPAILGILMWTRFSKKHAWISRYPLSLYIGISTGLVIPLEMSNRVNKQLFAGMIDINWSDFFGNGFLDITAGYSQLIILVGAVCALAYFFFSKAHTGWFGGVAKIGIWTLMIGFGASFGFTVMARIALFVNRIQFLDKQWIKNAFNSDNANYSIWFAVGFLLVVMLFLLYIIREIALKVQQSGKSTPTQA